MNKTLFPRLAFDEQYDPASRVWIYTASRPLTEKEALLAQQHIDLFTRQWTSHNQQMKAAGEVFERRYIILLADETHTSTGGCSIDKSVHFLEALGAELGLDFFDRMLFGWVNDNTIAVAGREAIRKSVEENTIAPDTLVVNNLCQTRRDLAEKWLMPYAQSWFTKVI